jgi:hypothetical protein
MRRLLLISHITTVAAAYSLFGILFILGPQITFLPRWNLIARIAVLSLSAASFLLGMLLLTRRNFRKSDIAIGVTTVAAFVLTVLAVFAFAALGFVMVDHL